MNPGIITLIVMVSLFAILLMGLPVAFSLFSLSIVFALLFLGPESLYMVYLNLFRQITKDIYIAIPLFIFMASIMEFSGIGNDLLIP